MLNEHLGLILTGALSLSASIGGSFVSTSSFAGTPTVLAQQSARPAAGDASKCPLRAADLDKLTPYRWQFAQYKADRVFVPNGSIRTDHCELIGMDEKGGMRTGVMVTIASGANAGAFAKHWRAACATSIVPEARGKVQPVPGVAGGLQCVTASGSASAYWIESPARTIHLEAENTDAALAKALPQLLAAAARS